MVHVASDTLYGRSPLRGLENNRGKDLDFFCLVELLL